jgi:UDP-N-acetylglucosamine acyltransferase
MNVATTDIHPTVIVHKDARLGRDVVLGPYCVLGGNVVLGDNVTLHSHVSVAGKTSIGAGCTIFPFASIGHPPQDQKYAGETSELIIGAGNVIREHVTMNPGTAGGGMVTRVGDNGLFMAGAHVAHDCQVGSHVILANHATLAGHVTVGDYAILGGLSAVQQFARIGQHAMVGGMSGVVDDVIPYGSVLGNRARLGGLNIIGLKRRGFTRDQIHGLRNAYRRLFAAEGTLQDRLEEVAVLFKDHTEVMEIVEFIRSAPRSICMPEV